MLFNTVSYIAFLSLAVASAWLLRDHARVWFLLLASVLFYGLWRVEFVFLICFSAWVDYFFSLRIHASEDPRKRRWFLIASLSTNVALLLYFKYTYFIVDNVATLGGFAGQKWSFDPGKIILPLGISFYTFLSISYTVDVYRRVFSPIRNFPVYLCYVMFWPHMIAGPILRAQELLPQLTSNARFELDHLSTGVRYVLIGLFLKVVLADNIAPMVDDAFAAEASKLSALDVWTMAFAFGFQIYFDFAGYSMIAIGSARLLGITFPENFNWPYLATSPRDFWKRWHITLSSWIRDYLYLPLAGRGFKTRSEGGLEIQQSADESTARMTIALFVTWFLMGLWHGASWSFALWGLWHATFILAYRMTSGCFSVFPVRLGAVLGWILTLSVTMLGWIPFRAGEVGKSLQLLSRVLDPTAYATLNFRENFYLLTFLMLVGMLLLRGLSSLSPNLARHSRLRSTLDAAAISVLVFFVFIFLRPVNQFIYFQF